MVKDIIVLILNIYLLAVSLVIIIYFVRHYRVTYNRLFGTNKIDYKDIIDDEYLSVTVMVPMHNEEKVIDGVMTSLLKCEYPNDRLEIIGVNDHSSDSTREMLDKYVELSRSAPGKYPVIKAFHRYEGNRGKQNALNDAVGMAAGEIILVFDADYRPPRDIIASLVASFKNPKVGAVMGRVVPINTGTNILTRLEDLERTGGYQVDQQAKYNLNLMPQYGGTVGGFRKSAFLECGKFRSNILAEDTDLTYELYINGYEIVYANSAECYEEVPDTWEVRSRQIARWSRGHNQILLSKLFRFIKAGKVSRPQRTDGLVVLFIYLLPTLWWISWFACLFVFYAGRVSFFSGLVPIILTIIHGSIGNFAPFFQIAMGCMIDGSTDRMKILPWFFFYFSFSLWYTAKGFSKALVDVIFNRTPQWDKTKRNKELHQAEEAGETA